MLRLGIVGLSDGNGHPYSWSAIFNGYDQAGMEDCGFPSIPRYLEKRAFPEDQISGAKVTHVWTQSRKLSEHIASTVYIENVLDDWADMIGQVDAILLARDDVTSHTCIGLPFIKSGIPIYIDKPLALSVGGAKELFDAQLYAGQIFSCSALRYATELKLSSNDYAEIGRVRQIHALTPNDWDRYAVHVIEPALMLANFRGRLVETKAWHDCDHTTLSASYDSGLRLLVSAVGSLDAPLSLRVLGDNGWKDLLFQDSFSAFRSALQDFVDGVCVRQQKIPTEFVMEVVTLIEAGRLA